MRPRFNSRPNYNPNNQPQVNGTNAPSQQVMANPGNFCPNPMQMMPQFHMGLLNNPQLAMPPFSNPNGFFAPNQLLPFHQNQPHMQNLNNNNLNQFLAQNAMNMLLPNGQFNASNLVQSVNQLLQMQMANGGVQNPSLVANGQMGLMNFNGGVQPPVSGNGVGQPPMSGNCSKQGNSDAANAQGIVGTINGVNNTEKNWKNSHNQNPKWTPRHDASHRGFNKQQFHPRNNAKGNFKPNYENKVKGQENVGSVNFTSSAPGKPNEVTKKRSLGINYTAQEIQQWREERKKNYPSKANVEKKSKDNASEPEVIDEVTRARRQQLKEVLAKQAELGLEVAEIPSHYLSDSEQQADNRGINNRAFGKRGRFQNKFDRRGKFQNKFDKQGKFHQNDRFSKRENPVNRDPANTQNQSDHFTKRQKFTNAGTNNLQNEPSLLKKLLSSDIKRDKKHLLQVFRFMSMNSFFKSWPEKPLKFPEVIVRELGYEGEIVKEKAQVFEGGSSNGIEGSTE